MAAELGQEFDLKRAQATLAAYASLYLQEEVQAEALVRQIGDFARFLEVISFSQGSLLNLAREAEIPRKRAESYLGILEDLLISFRLPVFQRRAQRQLVQHQKFFYFDAGVFRSLRPRGPLDAPEEIDGIALESLVAQHLRALCQLRPGGAQLSFWRTRSGLEVDFIVYGPNLFQAIEVKRSRRIDRSDLKPLQIDGIRCEPLETWLRQLRP